MKRELCGNIGSVAIPLGGVIIVTLYTVKYYPNTYSRVLLYTIPSDFTPT